ncbi:hypothetical protein L9F63_024015 [Diploptera punctata]|uniref:Uncharacterized protein n=1 Tax=Diploptera punctata TaxID=6984 RepID=A0AAD8E8N8_DIPPU|nr:hypothetical protein L9F63_024015 [Diploptera punctata]
MIVLLLCVELVLRTLNAMYLTTSYVPVILDAINYNGLAFFLLANLLTGLVNVSVRTLYVDTGLSVVILCGYMLTLCWLTHLLHRRQLRLRL